MFYDWSIFLEFLKLFLMCLHLYLFNFFLQIDILNVKVYITTQAFVFLANYLLIFLGQKKYSIHTSIIYHLSTHCPKVHHYLQLILIPPSCSFIALTMSICLWRLHNFTNITRVCKSNWR